MCILRLNVNYTISLVWYSMCDFNRIYDEILCITIYYSHIKTMFIYVNPALAKQNL